MSGGESPGPDALPPATDLFLKDEAARLPRDRTLLNIRVREVAIILMVLLGAFTEAGLLFAPLITWVLMLAAIGSPEEAFRRPAMRRRQRGVAAVGRTLRRDVPNR